MDDALHRLTDAFLDERPFAAAARSIEAAFPGRAVAMHDGLPGMASRVGHNFAPPYDGWAGARCGSHIGALRRFDPRKPGRFANRSVLDRTLYEGDPESLARFHDVMRVDGLRDQLRIALWERSEFVGYCGIFSRIGDRGLGRDDVAALDAMAAPLRDVLRTARALGGPNPAALDVAQVLDAFDSPAFVATPAGHIAHANRAARARYRTTPELVRAAARRAARGEGIAQVQATSVLLRGERHFLLIPRAAVSQRPPWAALPPSLARVAELVAAGYGDKEIADQTDLSLATVRTYVTRIFQRLGIRNRRELMKYGRS